MMGGVMWFPCWMWKFRWNAWLLVTFRAPPLSIIIRETLALKNTLLTGVASGIDPKLTPKWTYSLPLVRTWTNQAGMSKALSNKSSHIQTTLQFYIALSLVYVSPGDNLTDVPSRVPSASVCMLSPRVWKEIENSWGPHSIYLKALDSKAPIAAQGCRLIYFSLCPTKGSAGVIVFSQTFHPLNNS